MLSFLLFFSIFDFDFLTGKHDFYKGLHTYTKEKMTPHSFKKKDVNGDQVTAIVGINYYLQEGWHFPLGVSKNLSQPEGANIFYTGAYPLLALFFKSIASITKVKIQYFGFSIFLSCLLLLLTTYKLLGYFFKKTSYLYVLGAFLILLEFFRKETIYNQNLNLQPHFLFIISFYCFLFCKDHPKKGYLYFSLVIILNLFFDIYFLAMNSALYLFLGGYLFFKTKDKNYLLTIAGTFLTLYILMFVVGYLRIESPNSIKGVMAKIQCLF